MAEIPDHIQQTLDELRTHLFPAVAEIQTALMLINLMEQRYGLPLTTFEDLAQNVEGGGSDTAHETPVGPRFSGEPKPKAANLGSIRPDQYLGHAPLDAAKIFLGQLGHAAKIEDITAAVQKGGAAVEGAKWKEALEMSLLRSVHDVIKVQDHTFGLIKFYTSEQINRLRGTRRQIPTKKKKRRTKQRDQQPNESGKAPEQLTPSPAQIERMKELRQAGKSLADIGKEFGLHHMAVFRLTGGKAGKPANAA